MRKTVIFGIDGAPYTLMKDLAETDVMPNFAKLIKKGSFKVLKSTIPEISSISWSSAITGKDPGDHGIFGFVDLIPNTYTLSFPNFRGLKEQPFWKHDDRKYMIINVPQTYPAQEMNGVQISGFVALDLDRAVYPESFLSTLKEESYEVDVDVNKINKSKDLFVEGILKTMDARITIANKLFKEEWDVFMIVFTGTDRLMHFMWDSYDDKNDPHHEAFLDIYRKVDDYLGTFNTDEYNFLMLSDHGFEAIESEVNVNTLLQEKGYLHLEGNTLTTTTEETKAFSLDPGRIYINLKDKFPKGSVENKDEVISELIELFENLEFNGKKVIKKAYRKEEIYSEKLLDKASDIILLSNPGFDLKSKIGRPTVFEKTNFTGRHNPYGFIYVNDNTVVPENPQIEQFVEIMKNLEKKNGMS